ncbi:hypothetical protein LWI28_009292 [Acer negundo]|uniref:Mediator of RNA polymerase II transcription subunit 6 n=1 Tax=Acer negundo TaxID=4023 RepID=A0AAD5ID38_ACENE|nr:hypothetical protein LWI28_009292 [Acer negundo]
MPRDQLWLNSYPLVRNRVFDYFALSPFYDWTCKNEQLLFLSIHPLDISQLSKMTGIEYMLSEVMEPHLLVVLDAENEGATLESKVTKENIDFKEVKWVDHILASLQHKLPPAPPLHHFQKVILQQQPEQLRMALKPNKQGSRNLLLSIPSSIKVQLKE